MNRILLAVFIVITFAGCRNSTKKVPVDVPEKSIQSFTGNYISSDYTKKAEGYDWVAVTIREQTDSSVYVAIRSRADKKKPTCQIYMPDIAENPKANKGYMGHDEFAIVESAFNHRFPIYKPGDTNSNPTGGMRQIQYKLKDGENSRKLVEDKIIEY